MCNTGKDFSVNGMEKTVLLAGNRQLVLNKGAVSGVLSNPEDDGPHSFIIPLSTKCPTIDYQAIDNTEGIPKQNRYVPPNIAGFTEAADTVC